MPASGVPKICVVPDEGLSSPAATLSSVDLPHPVGPTTETNSPSAMESVTSFTAVYEPPPLREAKVQVMRSKWTAAVIPLPDPLPRERESYLYLAFAFFTKELSNVLFRSIFPAAITEGSNC